MDATTPRTSSGDDLAATDDARPDEGAHPVGERMVDARTATESMATASMATASMASASTAHANTANAHVASERSDSERIVNERIVHERTDTLMRFNVMPGRAVEETLHVREYRVGPRHVEAHFDRTYHSEMLASPSHLIFLTALAHTQKMVYVWACHALGIEYDPAGAEQLKVWPTRINVEMKRMIRDEEDLVHRARIVDFRPISERRYHVEIDSDVNGLLRISGESPLFLV